MRFISLRGFITVKILFTTTQLQPNPEQNRAPLIPDPPQGRDEVTAADVLPEPACFIIRAEYSQKVSLNPNLSVVLNTQESFNEKAKQKT